MKKVAWPYFGNKENEFGLTDNIEGEVNIDSSLQDHFTPIKSSFKDSEVVTTEHSSGITSPVADAVIDMINDCADNETIVISSSYDFGFTKNYNLTKNIIYVSNYNHNDIRTAKNYNNIKYANISKTIDKFWFDNILNAKDLDVILHNNFANFSNIAQGYVTGKLKSDELTALAEKYNFSAIKHNSNSWLIKFNKLNNKKIVKICSDNEYYFNCDIVKNINDKIAGLQKYNSIPYNFGLYFKYKSPEDVTFHMATVNYPIDIIFVDSDFSIKKISKNIQPGSMEYFYCSSCIGVFEINGGLSDKYNIKIGSKIELLNNKDIDNYSPVVKTAAFLIQKDTCIFNLSDLYNIDIIATELASFDYNNLKVAMNGAVKTFGQKKIKIKVKDYLTDNLSKRYDVVGSPTALGQFYNQELKKSLSELSKFDGKIVIAIDQAVNINNVNNLFNNIPQLNNIGKKITFEKMLSKNDIFNIYAKYNNDNLSIFKLGGNPIPKEVIDTAKASEVFFRDSKEIALEIMENLKKNVAEYQRIQAQKNVVKNSKFDYIKSCKNNIKILKRLLLKLKKGLKSMNEIKDISSTYEIISMIAISSSKASDAIKKIVDLKDSIELDSFVPNLAKLTADAEKVFIDLDKSIERMVSFINQNILGVLVISG